MISNLVTPLGTAYTEAGNSMHDLVNVQPLGIGYREPFGA